MLNALGCAYAVRGTYARALARFTQALTIFQAIGDRHGEAKCSWDLAHDAPASGERARAIPLLCEAVAYKQEIGHADAAEHAALLARVESSEALFDKESVLLGSIKLFSTALALYSAHITLLAV